MRFIDVDKLKPHPKNSYFFDDIEGEPWTAFLESIETSGVIEPIIVDASDLTIISGHQRVRACKKLGIKQVAVEERGYDSEDERLKQLIETNIRQRGIGNANAVKFGRCVAELERIYGIRHGGDRTTDSKVTNGQLDGTPKTQSDLAKEIGVDKQTLLRAKKLAELPEELQQMVMDGKVTASTASRVIARLAPEDQKKLAEQIGGKDKVSGREVEQYIEEIKRLKEENEKLHDDNKILARRSAQEPIIMEKPVEVKVFPDDYEQAKKSAEIARKDFARSQKQYEEMAEKWKKSEAEKQKLIDEKNDPKAQKVERAKLSASSLVAGVSNFLEKFGGYSYLMGELDTLSTQEKKMVDEAVKAMYNWSNMMLNETVKEVIE